MTTVDDVKTPDGAFISTRMRKLSASRQEVAAPTHFAIKVDLTVMGQFRTAVPQFRPLVEYRIGDEPLAMVAKRFIKLKFCSVPALQDVAGQSEEGTQLLRSPFGAAFREFRMWRVELAYLRSELMRS